MISPPQKTSVGAHIQGKWWCLQYFLYGTFMLLWGCRNCAFIWLRAVRQLTVLSLLQSKAGRGVSPPHFPQAVIIWRVLERRHHKARKMPHATDSLLYAGLVLWEQEEHGVPNGTEDSLMEIAVQIDSEMDTLFYWDGPRSFFPSLCMIGIKVDRSVANWTQIVVS